MLLQAVAPVVEQRQGGIVKCRLGEVGVGVGVGVGMVVGVVW